MTTLNISHGKYVSGNELYFYTYDHHLWSDDKYSCYETPSKFFLDSLNDKIITGNKTINSVYINLCKYNKDKIDVLFEILIEKLLLNNQIVKLEIYIPKYKHSSKIVGLIKNNISMKYCYPSVPGFNRKNNKIICKLFEHFLITINKTTFVQNNDGSTLFQNNCKILPKYICMIIFNYMVFNGNKIIIP